MSGSQIAVLSNIGMLAFIALSAYLLLLAGLVSFGQQAFFGIGAYAAGIATVMWGLPLWAALVIGMTTGAAVGGIVGFVTRRLDGLYFAVASLAAAEMVRIGLELFHYQRRVAGEWVGPAGVNGFGDIRYILEHQFSGGSYLGVDPGAARVARCGTGACRAHTAGRSLRRTGDDPLLAALQSIDVVRVRLIATIAAGGIAGLGGGLYAHLVTYIEPQNFNIMLGVHSLAYGLIGGLGTPLGPILGVVIDIGLLEIDPLVPGLPHDRLRRARGAAAHLASARPAR